MIDGAAADGVVIPVAGRRGDVVGINVALLDNDSGGSVGMGVNRPAASPSKRCLSSATIAPRARPRRHRRSDA